MRVKLGRTQNAVGRGGGGRGGQKGDCNIFTLSRVQGASPNFSISADQINNQYLLSWRKRLSNQGNMLSITCCCAVVNFETSQGLQGNNAHEIMGFDAVTKLGRMYAERENSSLAPKKRQSPQVQMRAVFVALIFKISVGDQISVERTSKFRPKIYLRFLKGLELTNFAKQIF